ISARTARRMLHRKGLHAMHMIKKPLLTREHKRRRLEFARTHRDWTVEQWKQVIFSDETVIPARSSDSHRVKWTKPAHGLNPKLVVPTVQGGGIAIMVWGCISTYGFHDLILLDGTVDGAGYSKVLQSYLLPVMHQYFGQHPDEMPRQFSLLYSSIRQPVIGSEAHANTFLLCHTARADQSQFGTHFLLTLQGHSLYGVKA
ncbi:hypothetical protein EON65_54840, partial [archaeon]